MGKLEKGEEILVDITKKDKYCQYSGAWHNLATLYARQLKFDKV